MSETIDQALVLAGDVGGTKTVLGIYAVASSGALTLHRNRSFASRSFAALEDVVADFLRGSQEAPGAPLREPISASAFGIPGPVLGDVVSTTNLPWLVERHTLARTIGCDRVVLMNDLETTAYGTLLVPPEQLLTLNQGVARAGNRAVIASGTGLGQGFLFWDGRQFRVSATEGGHVDFAPRNEREIELLRFFLEKRDRVSYECILSGGGLVSIFDFLVQTAGRMVSPELKRQLGVEDPAAVIGDAGVSGECATSREAVDLFLSVYGAQAGNLALTVMAIGGVYVAGGIARKLLPRLVAGGFMAAFLAKPPQEALVRDMPVQVVLDPHVSLLGAAHVAAGLLV